MNWHPLITAAIVIIVLALLGWLIWYLVTMYSPEVDDHHQTRYTGGCPIPMGRYTKHRQLCLGFERHHQWTHSNHCHRHYHEQHCLDS